MPTISATAEDRSTDNDTSPSGNGTSPEDGQRLDPTPPGPAAAVATAKRTRVLLSCAPCRFSKLKCDRKTPCSQCTKKGRVEGCVYAPRPEKSRPTKSMSARLKRLEGMVRDMMETEASEKPSSEVGDFAQGRGQVVFGKESATYVGATHFMAMLDDIEDLKGYFEEEDEIEESPEPESLAPELFALNSGAFRPSSRRELVSILPPKQVVDRLIHRYFNANSPSQHIIHRPTFLREYGEFYQNPDGTSLEWIALLLLIVALGTFFSAFQAPHELAEDSDLPPMELFRRYRGAAAWALVQARYTHPKPATLAPLLLYVEGEFLVNRNSQMQCYVVISVCLRIMLKMGLHRDPSKLPNIAPFEGEMRRRMWNLAVQIDLIVSFHLGLPSMIHGIESDTGLPRNLFDDDLEENCKELPPARPDSVYTHLTYPIWKSTICRVFGLVARQAHSLSLPSYADVMKLDSLLEEKWRTVPSFMKIKPLNESIIDPPTQINQRFGLAALYQKSRCVLHRRYLIEAVPKKEHAHSRRVCLEAALALLHYQEVIYEATQPGGVLRQNGWFVTSIAVHDFLLAAMVVYLVIQSPAYSEVSGNYDWMEQGTPLPNKEELRNTLQRSHRIWDTVAGDYPAAKKASNTIQTMLSKLPDANGQFQSLQQEPGASHQENGLTRFGLSPTFDARSSILPVPISGLSITGESERSGFELPEVSQTPFSKNGLIPNPGPTETAWLDLEMTPTLMDWNTFEQAVTVNEPTLGAPDAIAEWFARPKTPLMEELGYTAAAAPGFWGLDDSSQADATTT